MVTIPKGQEFEELSRAAEMAKQIGQPVLVSRAAHIGSDLDPIALFGVAKTIGENERAFWADASHSFVLVGVGSALLLEASGRDRFRQIEEKRNGWLKRVLQDSFGPSGTGPVWIGGFSFEASEDMECKGSLDEETLWSSFPDARLQLPRWLFTYTEGQWWITRNVLVDPGLDPAEMEHQLKGAEQLLLDTVRDLQKHGLSRPAASAGQEQMAYAEVDLPEWLQAVDRLTAAIRKGELEKAVLARELRVLSPSPFQVDQALANLWKDQADSFVFGMEIGGRCFIGASPERLVKRTGEQVQTMGLAGSTSRGKTSEEDRRLGDLLLSDRKNLAEHEVVVRMIRKAMEEGCTDVESPSAPILYRTAAVQHLYTPLAGKARPGVSLLQMVGKLHPTPALCGYPQNAARAKIAELERLDRGWYGAPVGWIDARGDGEFAVAIRSGLLHGHEASLFAGCGIVKDSDPISEYEETRWKLGPMLSAIGGRVHEQ